MFPNYCGATGFAGWLLMLLVWTALVALAVWGITRLFPDRPPTARPPASRQDEKTPDVPVDAGRRGPDRR